MVESRVGKGHLSALLEKKKKKKKRSLATFLIMNCPFFFPSVLHAMHRFTHTNLLWNCPSLFRHRRAQCLLCCANGATLSPLPPFPIPFTFIFPLFFYFSFFFFTKPMIIFCVINVHTHLPTTAATNRYIITPRPDVPSKKVSVCKRFTSSIDDSTNNWTITFVLFF